MISSLLFVSVTAVYMKFHGRNGGYTLRYIICEVTILKEKTLNVLCRTDRGL